MPKHFVTDAEMLRGDEEDQGSPADHVQCGDDGEHRARGAPTPARENNASGPVPASALRRSGRRGLSVTPVTLSTRAVLQPIRRNILQTCRSWSGAALVRPRPGRGRHCGVTAEPPDAAPGDDTVERIGELLRSRGLRRMPSRIAVLAVLEPFDGHLSVAEIHQRIVDATPPVRQRPDLATVYRTVTTLVDQGVLHALAVEGGVTTYGLAGTAAPPRGVHRVRNHHRGSRHTAVDRTASTRSRAARSRCPNRPA